MSFDVMKIKSLEQHKIKRFEKEIRRYLKNQPEFSCEHQGQIITSSTYHIYVFKGILDKMYRESGTDKDFPFDILMFYSNIFTNRNLKTNAYEPKGDDDMETIDYIIDNHQILAMWIYDEKFPYKPENFWCRIACAINPKKRIIVPMQFSINLSMEYPDWFDGKLTESTPPEVGVDFDLIERIKIVME